MTKQYVIAVDQGTSSTRCFLVDERGNIVPKICHQIEREPIGHPNRPDWLEHDPDLILADVKECIQKCWEKAVTILGIKKDQVKAMGITNQRESLTVWDKHTGEKLHNMILWNDVRTKDICDRMKTQYSARRIQQLSGLVISPYFSGVKLKWMIENVQEVAEAVKQGSAICGTVDTWLMWNLARDIDTGGRVHVTDVTNAGRTMLMDIKKLTWNEELMAIAGATRSMLPDIKSCSETFGILNCTDLEGLPIAGLIGDQQGALVGQCCFNIGEAKSTYGTGGFLITNVGTTPKFSNNGLLTTPAYKLGPDDQCVYSLEGSVSAAGSACKWLETGLGIVDSVRDVGTLGASVTDTHGVVFVPALSGLFAPYWDDSVRGTIFGITHKTKAAHIALATMEGVSFRVTDVMGAMSKDMGRSIGTLKVDGGAAANDTLMQTQANLLGVKVVRPQIVETTALGAAFLAGHAVGMFQSIDEFRDHWRADKVFAVEFSEEERCFKRKVWEKAVQRSLNWLEPENRESDSGHSWIPSAISMFQLSAAAAVSAIVASVICRCMSRTK